MYFNDIIILCNSASAGCCTVFSLMSRFCGFGELCLEVWLPALCSTFSGKHIILLLSWSLSSFFINNLQTRNSFHYPSESDCFSAVLCGNCKKKKLWERKEKLGQPARLKHKENIILHKIPFTSFSDSTRVPWQRHFPPGEHLVYCFPWESTTGHFAISVNDCHNLSTGRGSGIIGAGNSRGTVIIRFKLLYVSAIIRRSRLFNLLKSLRGKDLLYCWEQQ